MDDRKGLAVVPPNPDFEAHARAVIDVDDPTHYEAPNLPRDHAVLDHHGGSGGLDPRSEGQVRRWNRRWGDGSARINSLQLTAGQRPHLNRHRELASPPGNYLERGVGDDVQLGRPATQRPGDGRAEP